MLQTVRNDRLLLVLLLGLIAPGLGQSVGVGAISLRPLFRP